MSTRRKVALLTALYLSQGLPFGFFAQALPVLLRDQGVSLGKIGLSSLLALPWALKFLWAPLVDRRAGGPWGRRRSWILPLQAAAVALLVVLAPCDPVLTGTLPLLVGVTLLNLVAATQDIATDGLAVELLSADERGLGNGVQVAGYRLGMILGGGVVLATIDVLGWAGAMLVMAGALNLATFAVVGFDEPGHAPAAPSPAEPAEPTPADYGWGRPGLWAWLGLLAAYKLGDAFGTGMLRPFLRDLGLDLPTIGWLLGGVGFTAGLLGALLGGALVNRLGRRRALVAFALLQAAGVACYLLAALSPPSRPTLAALCAFEHLTGGMATAALFTWMMDACREEAAATDYTVQACTVVIATGVASALSGFSAQALGYPAHFALSTGLALAAAGAVAFMAGPPADVARREPPLEAAPT